MNQNCTQANVSNSDTETEHKPYSCISLRVGIGLLAIASLASGSIGVGFGIMEIYYLYNSKLHVQIRLDPVILRYQNPEFDGGMTDYLQIWYAASIAGIICGLLQSMISVWYLFTICKKNDELNYSSKLWLIIHLVVSFIILTLMGGIYIAGFDGDLMLLIFTIDFLIVNSCILLSMPLIRKEEKQPKAGEFNLIVGKNLSSLSNFLLV